MKKLLVLAMLFGILAVLALSLVSAKTLIAGKIYNSDYSDTIAGASVQVTCVHGGASNVRATTSLSDGTYAVTYEEEGDDACNNNDEVTVYAEKDGLSGSKTGIVNKDVVQDWDISILNVAIIPEFGLFVGILTLMSSLAMFLIIRRK